MSSDSRKRIDVLLVEKGFCESREKAKELIISGKVRVGEEVVIKPSHKVPQNSQIFVEDKILYVSRGYLKIKGAFEKLNLSVDGIICADIGCSTGGFTQFLLEMGAKKVYSIDVGKGVLHQRLRENPKVVVMEGVDAKNIKISDFDEVPEFGTLDVSFTSSIPVLRNLSFIPLILLLCKPNFEVPRKYLKKGVLKDPEIAKLALKKVVLQTSDLYDVLNVVPSRIRGTSGNAEFFILLKSKNVSADVSKICGSCSPLSSDSLDEVIRSAVESSSR